MGWSFRKRVKVIPGIYLNFSKTGISTSIGVRGASVTIGKNGTYLNTGIPGTGISNRIKLSGSSGKPSGDVPDILAPNQNQPSFSLSTDNIFSVDVEEITSQDMRGIKEAILLAHQQRKELASDLSLVSNQLRRTKFRRLLSYCLLYGFFFKQHMEGLKLDIAAQEDACKAIKDQLSNSRVSLSIEFDPEIKSQYDRLQNSFRAVMNSNAIWDITAEYANDRVVTRSSASASVVKKPVRFEIGELQDIKCDIPAMIWKNANGADLYFFPNFVVAWNNKERFAIVGYNEIDINFSPIRFVETDGVPADSKVIDKTWFKVNKNGSPDRRFKNNYQIPVVRYGDIQLATKTGLNERYMISNYEASEIFSRNFLEYQITILKLDYKPQKEEIRL